MINTLDDTSLSHSDNDSLRVHLGSANVLQNASPLLANLFRVSGSRSFRTSILRNEDQKLEREELKKTKKSLLKAVTQGCPLILFMYI